MTQRADAGSAERFGFEPLLGDLGNAARVSTTAEIEVASRGSADPSGWTITFDPALTAAPSAP